MTTPERLMGLLHETVVFVRATASLHAISRPHQRQEASLLKKDSDL